jgi:hypothetical protein
MHPTFTFPASNVSAFACHLLAVHLAPPASALPGHVAGAVLVRADDDLGSYVAAFVVDENDRQQLLELQAFHADHAAGDEHPPAVGIIGRGYGRSDTSAQRYQFQASAMVLQSAGEHRAAIERWLCDLAEAEPLCCS